MSNENKQPDEPAAFDDVKPLVDEWMRSRGTCMDGSAYGAAIELAAFVKARAASNRNETLPFESALSELIGKIDSNLDSGDVIRDARRASAALDAILTKGDLVANAYDHFRDAPDRAEKSIDFRIGWDACLDALINARAAASHAPATEIADCAPYAHVYEYDTPFGVHRQLECGLYNGARPSRAVKVYAAPTEPCLTTDVLTPADWRSDFERQARIGDFNLNRADERDEDCDAGDYRDPESQAAWMWYYRGRLDGECGVGSISSEEVTAGEPPEAAHPTEQPMSDAARDVLAERARQVCEEGWTPAHDDQHSAGEMARAASQYALNAAVPFRTGKRFMPAFWPWSPSWWKPTTPRRDLIKAGALILAEIERIDRAGKLDAN